MAKHTYILQHDYFSTDARLYKEGDKIVLDEKDDAVKLCAPLQEKAPVKAAPKSADEDEEKPAPKKKAAKKKPKSDDLSIFE